MDFAGKVVLITGGAGGIGQALGREFLERGAKVSLCDINVKMGNELVETLQSEFGKNVIFSKCDVTNGEEFKAVYDECEAELGTIDILCNNAGILSNDFQASISINYGGVVIGTELAMKRMGKHHGGKGGIVINIASIAGVSTVPFVPFYASSKAAVIHYSRCVGNAFHYQYTGVSVLCICPNGIDTEIISKSSVEKASYNSQSEKAMAQMMENIVLFTPKEAAEAFIQFINENKTGEVMVLGKKVVPFYVPPALDKEL